MFDTIDCGDLFVGKQLEHMCRKLVVVQLTVALGVELEQYLDTMVRRWIVGGKRRFDGRDYVLSGFAGWQCPLAMVD